MLSIFSILSMYLSITRVYIYIYIYIYICIYIEIYIGMYNIEIYIMKTYFNKNNICLEISNLTMNLLTHHFKLCNLQ